MTSSDSFQSLLRFDPSVAAARANCFASLFQVELSGGLGGLHTHADVMAAPSGRQAVTLFDREGYDEVTGKRKLRALRSSAEWRGVVQGRVVANLRPDNEAFELFRDGRLDGKSDRQRTVGRRSAADRHSQWIAMFDPDKVQVARERGDKETVIVAPDLSASGDLQPIVDRIGRVLGHTVASRVEPIITNVVHVGCQGELVGWLPDDGHVIEIAESSVGIDAGKNDRRHIGIFWTDMGGCRNG